MEELLIVGAGEHAKVVLDVLLLKNNYKIIGFLHTKKSIHNNIKEYKVLGHYDDIDLCKLRAKASCVAIAIGDNKERSKYFQELNQLGFEVINVIHPLAYISNTAGVGRGVFIGPYAIVNTDALIGDNVIINSSAVIEHDCIVEDHAFVSIGARLAGGVKVRRYAFIGAGAVVLDDLEIGEGSVVYAGAVVTKNVAGGRRVRGVPAEYY